MNQVILIGRLVADPELKYTSKGTAACDFRLAVNRRFKNEEQQADFFYVTAWGKTAEAAAKYLRKGNQCAVRGRIEIQNYTDKEGNKRTATKIQAEEVEFLGGGERRAQDQESGSTGNDDFPMVNNDDIPF